MIKLTICVFIAIVAANILTPKIIKLGDKLMFKIKIFKKRRKK